MTGTDELRYPEKTGLSAEKARLLDRLVRRRVGADAGTGIAAVAAGTRVPLTPPQARIWFFTRLYPASSEYNVYETLTFDRGLHESELVVAVRTLMERHDALRLRFVEVDGSPMQEDCGELEPPVRWHDLRRLRSTEAEARAQEIGDHMARWPVRADSPPLFRFCALVLPGNRTLIVLVVHHLIIDYWSTMLVLKELGTLLAGGELTPSGGVRFLEYAAWQSGVTAEQRQARDLAYWKRELGGDLPVLDLPKDRPRPAQPSRVGHAAPLVLSPTMAASLRELASREGTTLFVVLLAAYKVFLARLTGQADVIVGAPLAGRDHPMAEDIVGCFIKPMALRTDLSGNPSFRELVHRVRETVLEAQDHQSVPYERLVAELGVSRTVGVNPVFQTFFGLQSATGEQLEGVEIGQLVLDGGSAKWDLTVSLNESPDHHLAGFLEYASDLFDERTAARFAGMYLLLLRTVAAEPECPIREVPLITPPERDRILNGLNPYRRPDHRYRTMSEPFEDQAARTPGAVALMGEEGSLSYAELNERANRLAHFLRARGAGPGTFVGLCAERGFALVVAIYAIAKSGAAYVPLDPELPDERIAFMLEDAAPVLVLADNTAMPRIPDGSWLTVPLEEDERWAGQPADNPAIEGTGSHLVHLLYTSGSTGRPKAVAYPVEGALANIFWLQRSYPFGPGDANLFKTSYGFDVSIWELFWPLYFGATLAVCPPGAHRDPDTMLELVERHRVTTVFLIPTMMQVFLEHAPAGSCPSLRWVFCGGEPVTPRVRDGFHERFDARLINCYGPTEAGCVTDMVLTPDPGSPVVPLGRPAANFRLYVLDDELDVAPIGVPGEAFIGGEIGLARGYHGLPGLTAERFVPDPFGPPGSRMYRTGDLCRYREDGVLEHRGRIGRQVKVRGVRIEPAEIEAVLCEHPAVEDCAVIAVGEEDRRIAAFVVPRGRGTVPIPDLLGHARRLLPGAMLPATITEVTRIPSNVNGKIDHRALVSQLGDAVPATGARQLVPPDNELETGLVAIFRRVLGIEEVGVTEGFFELGGHSLLVFKLIDACSRELRLRPSVADVFSAPSVRQLAARLNAPGDRAESVLVPLAPAQGRPLLVFIHAASGSALPFLNVARHLQDDFDVYGLEAPDDPESRSTDSITNMAALYAAAVDEVRSTEPLVLVGWSMGGCVALEMAREWRGRGWPPDATVLLDTWSPPVAMESRANAGVVRRAIRDLDVLGMEGISADSDEDSSEEFARLRRVTERNRNAFLGYTPTYYDGPIDLVCAREDLPQYKTGFPDGYLDGDRGWQNIAAAVDTYDVRGDHFSVLAEDNVGELAAVIRQIVESRTNGSDG